MRILLLLEILGNSKIVDDTPPEQHMDRSRMVSR